MLNRVLVSEPPVSEAMYENSSILYLKPVILDHDHVSQVETKLKAMPKSNNKKILLDLRDVAAGDMGEATRLANLLLKSGTIAQLEGQKVAKQTFAADPAKYIEKDTAKACKLIADVMAKAPLPAVEISVPLVVEARAADNWDAAH